MDPMAWQGRIGAINGGGLERLAQSEALRIAGPREIELEGGDFGRMLGEALSRTEGTGAARPAVAGTEGPAAGEGSFLRTVGESIEKVNTLMNDSDRMIEELATGRSANVHGTLIALQKADISFRMLLEVRSKVMKAYEEVMRMQV